MLMDYKRIYSQFIESRRLKEQAVKRSGEYSERHHILPRCLGGDDSPENLIRLTPGDHYFAHLLLAKIHGGKLWFAVIAMANMDNGTSRGELFKKRIQFSHIRKAMARNYAENYSGENSPVSDKAEYTLTNMHTGESVTGTRVAISDQTGLSSRAISALILGQKGSYSGWYYPEKNPEGKTREERLSESKSSGEVFHLFHHDGEEFRGTRSQFRARFGKRLEFGVSRDSCYGWYRTKEKALNHAEKMRRVAIIAATARGDISGSANPNVDNKVYEFENERTGEIVSMTRVQLRDAFGLKTSQVTGVIKGTQIAAGDWKLKGAERQRKKRGR